MRNKKNSIFIIFLILLSFSSKTITINFPSFNKFSIDHSVELSSTPNILWNKTWRGKDFQTIISLAEDSNKNIYAILSNWTAEPDEFTLLKYNASGYLLWNRSGIFSKICCDPMNNVYAAYSTNLSKYDSEGNLLWEINWELSGDLCDLVLDSQNNIYLLKEHFYDGTNRKYCLMKINAQGNHIWNKTWLASLGHVPERVREMAIDSSDNIYIAGVVGDYPYHGTDLFKLNTSGSILWERTCFDYQWVYDYDIECDSSDDIIISFTEDNEFFLYKYNSSGELIFKIIEYEIPLSYCAEIALDKYDNLYSFGTVNNQWCLAKHDNLGNFLWNYTFEPTEITSSWCNDILIHSSGSIFLGGYINNDAWLIKLEGLGLFSINNPTQYQVYGVESPNFSLEFHESIINKTWYTVNNSENYFFSGETGKINQDLWKLYGNGNLNIKFYANDSFGVIEFEEVNVRKDIVDPIIIIQSPEPYQVYGNYSPNCNLLIDDPNLDSSWYTLDGGLNNYTFSSSFITINQTAWEMCNNGTVEIIFYANDTVSNLGFTIIEINKDIYAPYIQIIQPESFKLYGKQLNYNIIKHGKNINSTWYTINNSPIFMFNDSSGEINQYAWNNTDEGLVILKFYINDSISREVVSEVQLYKDAIDPIILINSPLFYELFGVSTPNYIVYITDLHLESMWYTLDDGLTNFTFFSPLGIINQSTWISQEDGNVTIRFYASDLAHNIAFEDRKIVKDSTPPNISIIAPESHAFLDSLPSYNILINEVHLDRTWYSLNNGIKLNITSLIGVVNQSEWDACEDGYVNITFYANDLAGNLGYKSVIVIKNLNPRNAYAVVIGISNYPGTENDLSYCDDDAIEVYNMLIDDYNFRSENIIFLQDSSATKSAINNAFNSISSMIDQDDIFYFYYSGHGGADLVNIGTIPHYIQSPHPYPDNYDYTWWYAVTDAAYMRVHFETLDLEDGYDYLYIGDTYITEGYYYQSLTGYGTNFWSDWIPLLNDNRIYVNLVSDYYNPDYYWGFRIDMVEVIRYESPHYLCPYDSLPSNPSNYYTDNLLDSKLNTLNCDHKYVVIDACNSGGMITETQATDNFIMTACKGGQFSMEDPVLNNGIFTYYLLESVDNANDLNGDGILSTEECFSYVSSRTKSYSASYGPGIQYHPQIYDGIDGESVLYPALSPISYDFIENQLNYSFILYGHGLLKTLNITVCTISPNITFNTFMLEDLICTSTGFGYYNDFITIEEGYNITGFEIFIEVEGNEVITLREVYGDSDNDGLTDIFEILQGNGLDPSSNDTDSDGLLDGEEVNLYGTDPLDSDSDSDGLLDGEEVNLYGTDPLDSDSDSDGLLDGEELNSHSTDPLNDDTDSDMIPDGWEINNQLDPLTNDSAFDPDNDYLTNLEEYQFDTQPFNNDTDSDDLLDGEEVNIYNTDPLSSDTDSDGLLDGEEVNIYYTDPLSSDTDSDGLLDGEEVNIYYTDPLSSDTDSDGLLDGEEVYIYNTDPLNIDTDSDMMPDKWEVDNLLNPLVNDANLDPDIDGLTNIEEYLQATNPQLGDTDGDNWNDGVEVDRGTNPLDPDDHPRAPSQVISGYYLIPLLSIIFIVVSVVYFKKKLILK